MLSTAVATKRRFATRRSLPVEQALLRSCAALSAANMFTLSEINLRISGWRHGEDSFRPQASRGRRRHKPMAVAERRGRRWAHDPHAAHPEPARRSRHQGKGAGGGDRPRGQGVPQEARHHRRRSRGRHRHFARHAVEDRERHHLAVADHAAGAVAGARRSGHRLLPPLRGRAQRRLRQGRRRPRRRAPRHARRPPVQSARPYRLEHQRRRGRALSDHADRGFRRLSDLPARGHGVPLHAGRRGRLPARQQPLPHEARRQPVLRRRRAARPGAADRAADALSLDHLLPAKQRG